MRDAPVRGRSQGVPLIRYLPYLVELGLLVYCLIDCIQTDSASARNLSKTVWIILIILVPIVGPIAWLVAGRPTAASASRSVPWPSTATAGFPEYERPRPPRGPDDDPAFLAGVQGRDTEHERLLKDWEATLREREARLRGETAATASGPADTPAPDETPTDDERR